MIWSGHKGLSEAQKDVDTSAYLCHSGIYKNCSEKRALDTKKHDRKRDFWWAAELN